MKELDETYKHLDTCDKYTRDLVTKTLELIGRQMIHERALRAAATRDSKYWYERFIQRINERENFKNKNVFMRIILAIKKEL